MPFYISTPVAENGLLALTWDAAYDFTAEMLYYEVEVATDYAFRHLIFHQENIILPETQMQMPAAGQYFVRVYVTNESGYRQTGFDYYRTENGKVYGVKCFYIQPDGSVVEDTYEE